jgi:hypothetical protein
MFAALVGKFYRVLAVCQAQICVRTCCEAVLMVDNAQLDADPEALCVFRANHVRVIALPPHCTHGWQRVDIAWAQSFTDPWAKSFKDGVSALVRAEIGQNVLRLLTMLSGERVMAMKERSAFVMCGLVAYR